MIIVKYFNLLWNKVGQSGTVKKKKKTEKKGSEREREEEVTFLATGIFYSVFT